MSNTKHTKDEGCYTSEQMEEYAREMKRQCLSAYAIYCPSDISDMGTYEGIEKTPLPLLPALKDDIPNPNKELIREVIMRQALAFPETEQDLKWSEQKLDRELMIRLFEYLELGKDRISH